MTKSYLLSTSATYSPPTETTAAGEALEPATQSPACPPETRQPPSSASRRGRPQAPRAPPQHRSGAYSVAEFCEAYGVSVPFLYKLWAKGEGPDVMKVGTRTLITFEAADRWSHQLERTTKQLRKKA